METVFRNNPELYSGFFLPNPGIRKKEEEISTKFKITAYDKYTLLVFS